jgi:itaconyl-CoA hydratase
VTAEYRGRFFEDFTAGDVYRTWTGRTVLETDNVWFSNLTMNTNQMHFNREWAARTEFDRPLVVSTFTLALVLGMAVRDTSENAIANLGWTDIKLPKPVFVGDTLWAESEVLSARESKSRPFAGIVEVRTRGINQRHEVVIEFRRSFMIFKRDAPELRDMFPLTSEDWSV